jgi:Rieske Fe-S protein
MASTTGPTRRTVLAGAVTVTGAGVLAACGAGHPQPQVETPTAPTTVAQVSQVPVGGALAVKLADGNPLLVTQPTAGEIHVFSAVCTHQRCTVLPGHGELDCPCHGSRFDLTTAKVIGGPAPRPLPEIPSKVQGGHVVVG